VRGHKWELKQRGSTYYVIFYLPGGGDHEVRRSTGTSDPRAAELRAGEIWVEEMRKAGQRIPEAAAEVARTRVETAVAACIERLEREAGQHREQYARRHREDLKLYIMPKTDGQLSAARLAGKELWQPPWRYVDEVTTLAWEREKLRLHHSNGGPLKWASIRHLTVSLRKLLHNELEHGRIENLAEIRPPSNKLVRQDEAPRRAYTEKEREDFLKAIKKGYARSWRFYTVLFFSLLRRGELFALTPRWVDFKNNWIRIPANHSKSGEVEEIDLHPRAARALSAELREHETVQTDAPLFGEHDARKAFFHGIQAARIDPHGLVPHHSTRHTGATMVGESTTDLLEIMAAMRVRSPQIAKRYLHVDAKRARRVMRKL
jgi:integrase